MSKPIDPIYKGQPIQAAPVEAIRQEQIASRVTLGPGITGRKSRSGVSIVRFSDSGSIVQVAKTVGGIAARVGAIPGSGSVVLQRLVGGSFTNAETVTAYNWAGTTVGSAKYIVVATDPDGNWFVVSEDCVA